MTSHSEITMIDKRKRGGRKASEMTPKELKVAQARTAYAREQKRIKAEAKSQNIDLIITFDQAAKAYEAKIKSLEHQAIQYRTVIDYLESKVDSLLSRK